MSEGDAAQGMQGLNLGEGAETDAQEREGAAKRAAPETTPSREPPVSKRTAQPATGGEGDEEEEGGQQAGASGASATGDSGAHSTVPKKIYAKSINPTLLRAVAQLGGDPPATDAATGQGVGATGPQRFEWATQCTSMINQVLARSRGGHPGLMQVRRNLEFDRQQGGEGGSEDSDARAAEKAAAEQWMWNGDVDRWRFVVTVNQELKDALAKLPDKEYGKAL